MKKNKIKLPTRTPSVLITIVAAVLLLVLLFLPYVSAEEDYAEELEEIEDLYIDEENEITYGSVIDLSLYEYSKLSLFEDSMWDFFDGVAWVTLAFAVLAFLTLLCAMGKKPVGTIIFNLLAFAVFVFEDMAFDESVIDENRHYGWGFAHYLIYVALVAVIAGAVWMMVDKRKARKAAQASVQASAQVSE